MILWMKLGFTVFLAFLFVIASVTSSFAQDQDSGLSQNNGSIRSCLAKEKEIKGRMNRLQTLAGDMQIKFDAIANRVEVYYTSIMIPDNKLVPEYSKLVTEIQVKRSAVLIALNNTRNDVDSFNCGNNPKTQLTKFKDGMRDVKSALKAYRTSVKNLIVAVRSAKNAAKPATTIQPNE